MTTTWSGTKEERDAEVMRVQDAILAKLNAEKADIGGMNRSGWCGSTQIAEAIVPPMPEPELPSVTVDDHQISYGAIGASSPAWRTGTRSWMILGGLLSRQNLVPMDDDLRKLVALKYPTPTYRQVGWQVVMGDGFTHYFDGGFAAESFAEHAGGTKRAVYVVEGA